LVLERINKDLQALMVSDEIDPETGQYYMLQPYRLAQPVEQRSKDESTGRETVTTEYTGISFFVYHHTQTVKDPETDFPVPQLVGQMIEYRLEPIRGDHRNGHDLLRNGLRVNKLPLVGV